MKRKRRTVEKWRESVSVVWGYNDAFVYHKLGCARCYSDSVRICAPAAPAVKVMRARLMARAAVYRCVFVCARAYVCVLNGTRVSGETCGAGLLNRHLNLKASFGFSARDQAVTLNGSNVVRVKWPGYALIVKRAEDEVVWRRRVTTRRVKHPSLRS